MNISMGRGLDRVRASFKTVKGNKALIWFPFFSFITVILIIPAGFWVVFTVIDPTNTTSFLPYFAFLPFIMLLNLLELFIYGAFYHAANQALEGERVQVIKSFKKAWQNRKALLQWWLFSSAALFIIALIRMGLEKVLMLFGKGADSIIALIAGNILSLGWALSTFFAVPLLMNHPDRPLATLKRSVELFKDNWGESVIVDGSLGVLLMLAVVALVMIVGWTTIAINFAIFQLNPDVNSIIFPIVYAALMLPTLTFVVTAFVNADVIFRASLYRYAETGDYVGPFSGEMITQAFLPKKSRKTS